MNTTKKKICKSKVNRSFVSSLFVVVMKARIENKRSLKDETYI